MKNIKVKELMIPLDEYATVSEEATLSDAVIALEEAQRRFDQERDRHRAVLVYDRNRKIIGKISRFDVIHSLEPKYEEIGDLNAISRFGWSPEFIKSMLKNYGLWEKPMQDICRKASQKKVKDIMVNYTEGECVAVDASLDDAIHLLVMGHLLSLLVTSGTEIIGILRLSDVFKEV
ncbi:MAG: CBS domain-containing protein, partial [Desulforhabdus sp.]|nr:CBS domain-containing protein [Desulforhabdus sp.]